MHAASWLVMCCLASPPSGETIEAEKRTRAMETLRKAGARFAYDESRADRPIVHVVLTGPLVTDDVVAKLGYLTALRRLELCESRVTDAGLQMVGRLSTLQTLYLTFNQISDAGIEQLVRLSRLEEIGLSYTNITDRSAKHLSGLKNLHTVAVSHTAISDEGLTHLRTLPRLRRLFLDGTLVTSKGTDLLKTLPLQTLRYAGTRAVVDGVDGFQKAPMPLAPVEPPAPPE